MENRSEVRVRSLGRKGKLIFVIILVGTGLALFLRLFSIFSPSILPTFTGAIISFLGNAIIPIIVVIVALSLVLVSAREMMANCRFWQLFLRHRRTNVMIPSVIGDGSILGVNCGGKKEGEGFAISMLKLLSVPREGVRQRVRGAVAREEQEEGAAVSDEKQYQFSHLGSLSRCEEQQVCMAYEVQFRRGLVNVGFTVSSGNGAECRRRRDQLKANVLTKFPVQLVETDGEELKDAALMSLPCGVLQVEAVGDKAAHVSGRGFSSYIAVVALRGRPEMSAHEQRCQIDQLITGINSTMKNHYQGGEKKQLGVNFVVSFESSKPPRFPSDAALRERLREKPEVKLSLERKKVEVDAMEVEFGHRTGWWKVSPYAVILGQNRALVEEKADLVANVVRSVWSGSHFSPECTFLHGKEVVQYFPSIMRRAPLPKRYVTEMSSVRLSSLVHVPEEAHPPLSKVTPPPFEAPDPTTLRDNGDIHDAGVTLGDVLSPVGGVLYPLALPISALGTHVIVLGESGFGKTCFVIVLLTGLLSGDEVEGVSRVFGGRVPFLVLDQKGEYRCLILRPEYGIAYFLPASQIAPLNINLFDPQGDDPDSHAKRIFNIIREILFANRTELTPQMERVLYDVLRMSVGGDWTTFNENLSEYLAAHGGELPQLEATIQGILNRVGQFIRPPLSYVFDHKRSNVDFRYLVERSAIIDLSEIRRQGTPEDVRLVANIIGKYVSVASLNRGADFGGELKHLFIVDDALDVVPEVLAKKTTADVGTIEYMAILLRATGQGLVVISQRPNIAENVISNAAVKVFFRTVVDSRELAMWVNLSEEQAAYLKVLPRQEAIITVPVHSSPMRIRIPDVGNIVTRKVTNHDIIKNNMINYPLMYDIQSTEVAQQEETNENTGNREKENQREEETRKENGGGGGNFQGAGRGQRETILEEDKVSRLAPSVREAWPNLRDYLMRGLALDSDFISKMLGVSQPVAHRTMLSLKSARLVSIAKIPNYAYGEGFQYLYYSSSKCLYGGGVVGYVRERIYSDLVGREAIVELSPKDVPDADMIIQHDYAVVIHIASGGRQSLRLPALRGRVHNVAESLTLRRGFRHVGNDGIDLARVAVVTLWERVANQLDEARREGGLDGCLCVIPFSKRKVDMLADYVLHQVPLEILTDEERDREGKAEIKEDRWRNEVNKEPGETERQGRSERKKEVKGTTREGEGTSLGEVERGGIDGGTIRERVLAVVRELGGVEPRVIARRLGIKLSRVSEAARKLVAEGLLKIARNVPDLKSVNRPNATFYLEASRSTALHDTVMNAVWLRNIELGGKSRDYNFEHDGKQWHTDGLLENKGGGFLLEVVTGEYDTRILEQIKAYVGQLSRNSDLKGVMVIAIDNMCLQKLKEKTVDRCERLPGRCSLFISSLRSKNERLQLESLLKSGNLLSYHRNQV